MNRKKWIAILSLGALVVAVTFGAVAYRSATATTATLTVPTFNGFANFGRGFGGGYTNQDLVDALGISVSDLTAAYQTAKDAALKQAVEQGLITQAQADELKTNGSAFPFDGRWGGWLRQNGIDFDALLADALGITVEKLQAAYTQAFNARIDQAVTDGNLTQEQADLMKGQNALYANKSFMSAMQSAFESAVKQAVSDGVITQAQADLILKNASTMKGPAAGMGFGGPRGLGGFEGDRGFGRHGGWGGGSPTNPNGLATPTETS
jgi:hypothetical protein